MTMMVKIPTPGKTPSFLDPVPFMDEAVKYMEYAADNFKNGITPTVDYLTLFNGMLRAGSLSCKDFNPTFEFEYECRLSKQTIKTSIYAFARQVTNKHPELAGFELEIVDKFEDKILMDARKKFAEQTRLKEMLVKKPEPILETITNDDVTEQEVSEILVDAEPETYETITDVEIEDYDFEAERQASMMDDPDLIDCVENYDENEDIESFIAAATMDNDLLEDFVANFNFDEEDLALIKAELGEEAVAEFLAEKQKVTQTSYAASMSEDTWRSLEETLNY